ncbi:hypothetical protein CSA37_09285 [Candidatus Fermentibacteria bacterium]|nr:MAG: hypothetical protein CSA37_09285 [Candidatus Fermentibacteria bacterium]
MKKLAVTVIFLLLSACGASTAGEHHGEETIRVQGIVQVLHSGSRSETVIITDDATGEVFALVGEMAFDLTPQYGMTTSVNGRLTEEGYSVREDLRKIYVTDYAITDGEFQ